MSSTRLNTTLVSLEEEELMFWCSLVGADRPPIEAMPIAIACLEQEDLGFNRVAKKMRRYFEMGTDGHRFLCFQFGIS